MLSDVLVQFRQLQDVFRCSPSTRLNSFDFIQTDVKSLLFSFLGLGWSIIS